MDLLTKEVLKRIGKNVPNSGFVEATNMPEVYRQKIARQFGRYWKGGEKTRWDDAVKLYDADPEFWEKYYNGHRVSGFHPSHDRFLQGFPHTPEFRRALDKRPVVTDPVAREPVGGISGPQPNQHLWPDGRKAQRLENSVRGSRFPLQEPVPIASSTSSTRGHERTSRSLDTLRHYHRLRAEFGIRRFP